MAKRKSGSDEGSPHSKRAKITINDAPKQDPVRIQTSKDLKLLLAFEQDAGPNVKQKIQSFRTFLEPIAYSKESSERLASQTILLDYLKSQTLVDDENPASNLPDIVKTWQFATQVNVENLISSIAAVLALLLKTISSLIDFRDCGNILCKSLLQDEQTKIFDRGLSASRAKEYLITPCLRLLTEIVLFDGGQNASTLFRQRETTFKRLDEFLGMRRDAHGDQVESRKRPSAPSAKMNILGHRKVVRSMLGDISEDSPNVVKELLDILRRDIASDNAITHAAKGRFFDEWTLSRLASLYSYSETPQPDEGDENVQKRSHNLLLFLCTSPGHGLLDTQAVISVNADDVRAGLPVPEEYDHDHGDLTNGNVRPGIGNFRLAVFLQGLRPHANLLQSELILAVFHIQPELVSNFFERKKTFSFDPKPTATWVGYSSFLLATIEQPSPKPATLARMYAGPPHARDGVIDTIMPYPLTQKIMTRCLNQASDLIKYTSIKILTAAFRKLGKVLKAYEYLQTHAKQELPDIWSQRATVLTNEVCSRVPEMVHVIAQFRNCRLENTVLQESITRLLALYYEHVPQLAFEAKFDISTVLSTTLQKDNVIDTSFDKDGIKLLELEHILSISCHSPNMQWWHKSDTMDLSPFTALLKLCSDRRATGFNVQQSKTLLNSIAREYRLLRSDDTTLGLHILLSSLGGCDEAWSENTIFDFLDNCILRFVRKPIHYDDLFVHLVDAANTGYKTSDIHIDLLLITVLEQWPFLVKMVEASKIANATTWLIRYLELSWINVRHPDVEEGTTRVLQYIRDELKKEMNEEICLRMFEKAFKDPSELDVQMKLTPSISKSEESLNGIFEVDIAQDKAPVDLVPPSPPQEPEDHSGLHRWTREDISDAIGEGAVEELILCLCSTHSEIRQQAVTNIEKLMGKLEASGYSEWLQTYILLGELLETVKDDIAIIQPSYFTGVLAARLLLVIANPLHSLYVKVNKFLNKAPRWKAHKLPSYWVDKILLKPPTEDEMYHEEVEWLLDLLVNGLCTPADFDAYHGCGIFERLLSLCSSSSISKSSVNKIIDLLFRCTYVEGSSALITRCGILSWISSRLAHSRKDDESAARLRALAETVYQTSEKERVDDWSNGGLQFLLDSLDISPKE